jgi:hypothetical protein
MQFRKHKCSFSETEGLIPETVNCLKRRAMNTRYSIYTLKQVIFFKIKYRSITIEESYNYYHSGYYPTSGFFFFFLRETDFRRLDSVEPSQFGPIDTANFRNRDRDYIYLLGLTE